MRNLVTSLFAIAAAAVAATGSARADPPNRKVMVAAKLGGIAPLDGLSPFVSGGVEVGYLLAPIGVVLAVDYTQPTASGTEMDPRVTGGMYTWKLTEQALAFMPTVVYRLKLKGKLVPYGGLGARVLLVRSTVRDNGAPTILETHEQSTKVGVGIPVGADLPLGPGRLLGELLFQYGGLDHTATGNSNTGAVSLSVGYRALF